MKLPKSQKGLEKALLQVGELDESRALIEARLQELRTKELAKEYSRACRFTESIAYAESKKTGDGYKKVHDMREQRKTDSLNHIQEQDDLVLKDLQDSLILQKEEASEIPAFLFLEESVVNEYGKCPFLFDTEMRKDWLTSSHDSGKLFKDVYERFILNKTFDLYNSDLKVKKEMCENTIIDLLGEENYNSLQKGVSTGVLGIPVFQWFVKKDKKAMAGTRDSVLEKQFSHIEYMVEDFIDTQELVKNEEMYIKTVGKKLRSEFLEQMSIPCDLPIVEGKYFKKWSVLKEKEKQERFCSFANYFIYYKLLQNDLIKNENCEKIQNDLTEILLENHRIKNLKYRDIVWNSKSGKIEDVKKLHWDAENQTFKFLGTHIQPVQKECEKKIKKPLINIQNEKHLNEHLLVYVLGLQEGYTKTQLSTAKTGFIDYFKKKINTKRISQEDTEYISVKFNEVYNVVFSGLYLF